MFLTTTILSYGLDGLLKTQECLHKTTLDCFLRGMQLGLENFNDYLRSYLWLPNYAAQRRKIIEMLQIAHGTDVAESSAREILCSERTVETERIDAVRVLPTDSNVSLAAWGRKPVLICLQEINFSQKEIACLHTIANKGTPIYIFTVQAHTKNGAYLYHLCQYLKDIHGHKVSLYGCYGDKTGKMTDFVDTFHQC